MKFTSPFLDDQIVEVILAAENNELTEEAAVLRVARLCADKWNSNIDTIQDDRDLLIAARNVCALYDSAVDRLEAKSNRLLVKGGFKKALLEKSKKLNELGF